MAATAQIYDANTFQPAKAVGQLMCRVRAAYIAALDEALAREPEIADLEISAAQYTILNVLEQRGVDSAAQLCKDISYDGGAMTRMVDRLFGSCAQLPAARLQCQRSAPVRRFPGPDAPELLTFF